MSPRRDPLAGLSAAEIDELAALGAAAPLPNEPGMAAVLVKLERTLTALAERAKLPVTVVVQANLPAPIVTIKSIALDDPPGLAPSRAAASGVRRLSKQATRPGEWEVTEVIDGVPGTRRVSKKATKPGEWEVTEVVDRGTTATVKRVVRRPPTPERPAGGWDVTEEERRAE